MNQEIRTPDGAVAKVCLRRTILSLEPGQAVVFPLNKLSYARCLASQVNTSRGFKSIKVRTEPSQNIIRVIRIE